MMLIFDLTQMLKKFIREPLVELEDKEHAGRVYQQLSDLDKAMAEARKELKVQLTTVSAELASFGKTKERVAAEQELTKVREKFDETLNIFVTFFPKERQQRTFLDDGSSLFIRLTEITLFHYKDIFFYKDPPNLDDDRLVTMLNAATDRLAELKKLIDSSPINVHTF